MKYKYVVYKDGKKVKGIIEANSIEDVYNKIDDPIISVKPLKKISFTRKVKKTELARVFNMIGLYLKSSMPILKAIFLVKSQESNYLINRFLDEIYTQIKEGKNFFNAIETQSVIDIPEYIKNAIKVGEESGRIDIVLIEMAKFLKEEEKILNKLSQSFIYPFFIVVVAVFMVSFMLTTVVPKIVKIFENLNQELPGITLFVINVGNFLKDNYWYILIFVFAFILAFGYLYKTNKQFKLGIDSFLLKLPIIKRLIISKELGRFSYLTFVLVNSGVNYIKAIELSSKTISNEKIKDIFEKALVYVNEGKKLSFSLKKAGFNLDESFVQSINLAEETSDVKNILKNLSEIYFEENQLKISNILSVIEPLLIIIVGGIIGFIVTALLLPMTNLNVLN